MSLSFKDSLENNAVNTAFEKDNTEMITENLESPTVMSYSLRSAPMLISDDWTPITNREYRFYNNEYSDEGYSTVDELKNISLDPKQFNITQERNSQYIPFQIPRYYDGFDLTQTRLSIYYVNANKDAHSDIPVDVYYNDEYIRFAWLVSEFATQVAGVLKFEIHADGVNSKGESYTWKSKSIDKLNVLQSLEDVALGEIGVSEEELESWYNRIQFETQKAEQAASEAQSSASEAARLVADLKDGITEEVEAAVDTKVESVVDEKISEQLLNYYTKAETYDRDTINQKIEDVKPIGYATIDYVNDEIDEVHSKLGTLTDVDGTELTVEEYVRQEVDAVDVSDELGDLTAEDGTARTVKQYVDDAVAAVDVSEQLKDYAKNEDVYTKTETYNKDEIDNALSNVSVDLSDYATKQYVTNETGSLSSSISTNTENISSLSTVVGDLQNEVSLIDKSPRLTYDVVYNDAEDPNSGENKFVLYEIENEGVEGSEVKTPKTSFTIVGGSGGGGTSSSLKIGYVTTSPLVVTINDKAIIKYTFTGTDSSGDAVPEGVATWKIGGKVVATSTALNSDTHGENSFDITDYLSVGTQKVNLSIVDEAGSLVTKTWTVQKIDVRLESTFNDKFTYSIGTVSFDYTPYGAISKDVHFILDGTEIGKVTTSSSGIPMAYELPTQEHGAHLLEVYMTAEINGNKIESNHIVKDIIWYDNASSVPVIGTIYQNFAARQYDATNIEYTVYDPSTETPTVEIAVDGNVVSTPTLDKATNVYTFKTDVVGKHTITITCGETVKTLTVNITKLDINVSPVTVGLAFDFNPSGKSNNDVDRVWSDGIVSMSVSDNFDWVNGGYQYDENGDQYFCIKAGTSAEIDYKLFADDAKKNGKEMKLVFKTTNVAKPDATFLSCMDNTTDTDHIGVEMSVHEAYIYGQAGKLDLAYSEEDIIEFEFNISKNTEAIPMVMGYEDGVSTRPMVYDDSYNFTQNTPKVISLGSTDCDLHIYRFKVYNTSLTDRGILNNFIADARNAEEMISRYDRNQIYDENSQLDPDVLAEKCPWLRVYKLSAPYFTNNKSDKVPNTTIQQIYKNGDPILDNWTCYDCSHSGQGTSSNNYGAAGRNLDFIMNKSQIEGVTPYFILGDGKTETDKITLTRTSVPVAYLNAKVNIASSNNMTNAMLANRYNEFQPYNRPFVRDEGVDTSFIKDTMQFANCVIFIQETNEDLSTHREFADTNWHFYAIGNIGDSKKSDKTRLTDMDDKYECCVEIMDVELPLSDFPVDTMYNAMGYKEDETTHKRTYTWAKNENLGILYEKINGEYVLTEDTEVDLTKTYYVDILEHDDFSEDFTYGWRYLYEGDDEEENAEVFDYCKQKWIELYRFITTSTDEEFKNRFDEYFVKDTALYYYLFTTRYCMADNRSKNLFFHYGKTNEVDSEGNPIRKWDLTWGYDMDTSLGLNNYGKQVYRYGLEDTDVDEKGEEVFRESDSTFFCRIRDLFPTELKAMYNTLESKNAWHAESFINKADEWQGQFPEELWRVDIERKYLRTYNGSFINGKGDAQFLTNMANGKMKYHRRQWERSQEKYMASKYQSSVASSDNSVFRCSVPNGDLAVQPNYRLKLTPYAYMYLNVKYGTQNPIQLRAEPNKVYEIPFDGEKADIVDVYSASLIQDFGDLSTCYVATADTSKAEKVKKLIFGNATEGYDNPNFTTLTTGANYLLEELNIENVSGLTQSLNLSALNNLKELYAHGSNIGGVTFADGGKIEIAELPAINALSMKNLMYLTTLDVVDFSKLTTLTVENCSTIDLLTILNSATNLNRVRIIGVDWMLADTSLLERLYAMKGIDKNGYNADQSVLAGTVTIPTIGEYDKQKYENAWNDLTIIPKDGVIPQYKVTFMNEDGTELDVQYIDQYGNAINPITREENPITTPTKESTVQYSYTFAGWDRDFTNIIDNINVYATYTESIREYTIQYVSMGTPVYTATGKYGTNIEYNVRDENDNIVYPTYTLAEPTAFYLFKRWNKSGFLLEGENGTDLDTGTKIVTAEFDTFQYSANAFAGKDFSELRPVEIYALSRLTDLYKTSPSDYGMNITVGDKYSFEMGYDIDYDDIESNEIISNKKYYNGTDYVSAVFDGTNYIDTGIKLFDEDRDFVLAVDYKIASGNSSDGTFMQCYQTYGTNGFRLGYSSGSSELLWGDSSTMTPCSIGSREMIVLRHIKGDNNLYVYASNLDSTDFSINELTRSTPTKTNPEYNTTLVFGQHKTVGGDYKNGCKGEITWCKIWYKDLGEDICKKLVGWTHEKINLSVDGFKRYSLYDDPTKEVMVSLIADHLLDRTKPWKSSGTTGGWASSSLREFLNTRFYEAIPTQIKSLMKKMSVGSTIGDKSTTVDWSDCYVTIPSVYDLDTSKTESKNELYDTNNPISIMQTNDTRKRGFDGGDYYDYWTRSPNIAYPSYAWFVVDGINDNNNLAGSLYGIRTINTKMGVLIEISF